MLKKRGQVYHLSKRVPKRYADVRSRTVIDLSLKTSSLTTAAQKAEETWNNLLQSWEYKLAGDAMSAEQRYRNALQTAQRIGFDYVPAHDIPKITTDEILDRLEASVDEAIEDAVLGLVPEAEIMISECLDVFLDCYPEKIHGKSSDQLRRYKEPRMKVIADFIKISGDKPISKITCQSAFKADPLSASNIDPLYAEQARRCVALTQRSGGGPGVFPIGAMRGS